MAAKGWRSHVLQRERESLLEWTDLIFLIGTFILMTCLWMHIHEHGKQTHRHACTHMRICVCTCVFFHVSCDSFSNRENNYDNNNDSCSNNNDDNKMLIILILMLIMIMITDNDKL